MGTDFLLSHEGVGREEWQEVHAGWLNVLFPLEAYVVHGVESPEPRFHSHVGPRVRGPITAAAGLKARGE